MPFRARGGPGACRKAKPVRFPLVDEVILLLLAVRVLGRDVVAILRRAAAAGVRLGISELRRGEQRDGRA